jgi:hypothetical protein
MALGTVPRELAFVEAPPAFEGWSASFADVAAAWPEASPLVVCGWPHAARGTHSIAAASMEAIVLRMIAPSIWGHLLSGPPSAKQYGCKG